MASGGKDIALLVPELLTLFGRPLHLSGPDVSETEDRGSLSTLPLGSETSSHTGSKGTEKPNNW